MSQYLHETYLRTSHFRLSQWKWVNSYFIGETKWRIPKRNQRPVLSPSSISPHASYLFLSICNCKFSLVCFYKTVFFFIKDMLQIRIRQTLTELIIFVYSLPALLYLYVWCTILPKIGASDSECSDLAFFSGKYCFCLNFRERIFLLLLMWITILLQRAHQCHNKKNIFQSFSIGHTCT